MKYIIHFMPNAGGGTPKHVRDLQQLFPQYNHVIISNSMNLVNHLNQNHSSTHRIHLHSAVNNNYTNVQWNIVPTLEQIHKQLPNIELLMTVHDYQWFMPNNPNPTREDFLSNVPSPQIIEILTRLFDVMKTIIFPSKCLFQNYCMVMKMPIHKCQIVPHCDIPISATLPFVPSILDDEPIRIAFVGYYFHVKGSYLFDKLAEYLPNINNRKIEYHVFGELHQRTPNLGKMICHGIYQDEQLVELLHQKRIHVVCHLSVAEETFCYALSRTMQSKLPIFYINRGSFKERLMKMNSDLYHSFENGYEIIARLSNFINEKVIPQQGMNSVSVKGENNIIATDWYIKNY